MAAGVDNESEILLGNKQLLGVFAVVVLLLAVAFSGGYMLGKNSVEKKAAAAAAEKVDAAAAANPLTKTVTPDGSAAAKPDTTSPEPEESTKPPLGTATSTATKSKMNVILGTPKQPAGLEGMPKSGQTYLQVGVLTHTQAAATADVLRKQHFRARLAPKPGSTTAFRVLVGPVRDAGDLAATRDSLRKIGFREVFVQRY